MERFDVSRQNSRPTRVLMTADATDGVWTYVMALANEMQKSGIEIHLAVMGPALSSQQRAEALALEHVELSEKPFMLEWMKDPWRDLTDAGDWLLELEEKFEPHVIHLNHYCHGSLPWSAPVMITAHGCVLSWWQAVHGDQSPHSWTRYHAEVSAGLRGSDLVVASTRAMLDALVRLYSPAQRLSNYQNACRFPELRLIPYGCDAARRRPMVKRDYVFCAGRYNDEALNLEMLDRIAIELPWPVVLAGSGTLREERTGRLEHIAHLAPAACDQMATAFGQAGIFALPTRYDPFGFAVLEAALSGCALLLGDTAMLRETWGEAALFAPSQDRETFSAVLHALVDDADLRREMAVRARELALTMTRERMAENISECYHDIAARHSIPVEMDVG